MTETKYHSLILTDEVTNLKSILALSYTFEKFGDNILLKVYLSIHLFHGCLLNVLLGCGSFVGSKEYKIGNEGFPYKMSK